MNERIKQLAGQAGLTFVNSITDDNEDIECVADTDGGLPCSTKLEKFAELIVRECCQVLEQTQTALDRHKWPTPGECGVYIKEHFGVEE